MAQRRILLTAIGGNTAQGIARSLREFPDQFSLVGIDCDKYNVRFGLDYTERVYHVPSGAEDGYIESVRRVIAREGIDVVIPSSDAEVSRLSMHRAELGAATLLPSHAVVSTTRDKWSTYKALEGKVPRPATVLIEGVDDIERCFSALEPPIWLRAREGAGGSRSFVAKDSAEARFWVEHWDGYGGFVASELVVGDNLSWIGLFESGFLVAKGGYRRIRYFMERASPTGVTGNVSVGCTLCDGELDAVSEAAVRAVDPEPNGVFTVDVKGQSGDRRVTEINGGRFHMSFYTYTKAGLNLPYLYVRLALERGWRPEQPPSMQDGVLTIRNTDNSPIFVTREALGEGVLVP